MKTELINGELVITIPIRTVVHSTNEVDILTPREHEIFLLLKNGKTNKEIAVAVRLEVRTVKFNVSSIFRKLGCESRAEVIYKYRDNMKIE